MWGGCGARSVRSRVRGATRGGKELAERTLNMFAMSVTLDVLKLSGWLNTSAVCVIERKACEAGSMRGARVRGAVEVQGACEGPKGNQGGAGHGWSTQKTCSSCL